MKLIASVTVFLLAASFGASAQSPVPPQPQHVLPDFYHAMDGDHWKNNQGWLDPEVPVCDWFGVTCGVDPEWDYHYLVALELPDNNLSGDLAEIRSVIHSVRYHLNLSGNRITGRLTDPNWKTLHIDLSNNQLEGPLPLPPSGWGSVPTQYLDLSGNAFEGSIPGRWSDLDLLHLDLSNNRLEGAPTAAFDALYRHIDSGYLGLANNRFEGLLPDRVMRMTGLLPHNKGKRGGGLNLCWNDLQIPNAQLDEWIRQHHVGGDNYLDCMDRHREPLEPGISGTWYSPARSGEGIVLHLLDSGDPLLYWFTFDAQGGQRWLTEVGKADEAHYHWPKLYETRGEFARGLSDTHPEALQVRGEFRFDRTGTDTAHIERVYYDPNQLIPCLAVHPPPAGCFVDSQSDRQEQIRLTRLAGTHCENQAETQWMSGVWRSPDASGEGFIVEVLDDQQASIYWFTYTPDDSGRQAWMTGVGEISGLRITAELVQPNGAGFGRDFDRDQVQRDVWGQIELEFSESRSSAHAAWVSHFEEYGSGEYTMQRLARPMLAECDDLSGNAEGN